MSRAIKFRFVVDGEIFSQEEIQKDPDLNLEFNSDGFKLFTFVDDGFCGRCDEVDMLVEQFTGLTDAKGVEVYVGDIIKFNKFTAEIVFPKNEFQPLFFNDWTEDWSSLAFFKGYEDFEVIGNIHENDTQN